MNTTSEQAKVFNQKVIRHITSQRLEKAKNLDVAFQNLEANDTGQFGTVQKLKEN